MDELLKKIEQLKKQNEVDLSMEEDLSLAIMNLISLEEHFFFTAEKTKKDKYFGFLEEARKMRKRLLAKMIPSHEGETWCIGKHLLAATMRMMEVGTKYQTMKKKDLAKESFDDAFRLYNLFWAIRLKLIDLSKLEDMAKDESKTNKPWKYEDIVSKLVDCCRE